MPFPWLTLLLFVGNFVAQRLLSPRPRQSPQHAKAASLSDFDIITATEGRVLPVLHGTRLIRGGNLGWYGDFSTTPIVESGSTIGYKYFLGAQIFLCHGPIEVLGVRFNEKSVGAIVDGQSNRLVVSKTGGAPWKNADVDVTNYSDGAALATAIEAALKVADPGDWRCTFGFSIRAGVNDQIKFGLGGASAFTAVIPAGEYNGPGLAAKLTEKMNAPQFTQFQDSWGVTYDGTRFSVAYSPGTYIPYSWYIKPCSILSTLGYRFEIDHFAYPSLIPDSDPPLGTTTDIDAEYPVSVNRFIVGYGGTTAALRLTDAQSTLAPIIGFSTAADREDLGVTQSDSDFIVIGATFTNATDFLQIDINDPDFFGNDGGLSGRLDVYRGSLTQVESDYMTAQLGETAPAYRGFAHIVERHLYRGDTNYPKPESVLARRLPNPVGWWTEDEHNIGGDANPAAVVYEALTDQRWGRGWPVGIIDAASFIAAGRTLKAEGLGFSYLLERAMPTDEFVLEIMLAHIDGMLCTDLYTGLVTLRLIRNDYDVSTIPIVDQDNTESIKVTRASYEATRNVVKLRYIDRDLNYTERVIDDQDLANIQARDGEQVIEDVSFPGVSNEETARFVLARTLRSVAALLAQVQIVANRESWAIRPGDPFLLDFAADGIVGMPCRAVRIEAGPIDAGQLTIDAIQDVTETPWPDAGGDISGWGVVYGYDWGGL